MTAAKVAVLMIVAYALLGACQTTGAPTPAPGTSSPVSPTPNTQNPQPSTPSVLIGDVSFEAEIASKPPVRVKGFSGRDSLPPKTGMLFVFESGRASSFWMREMRFALDFIWISADCVVADITADVPAPAPGTADTRLPTYASAAPAAYNFEINAGEAAMYGLSVGDPVRFAGVPPGTDAVCPPN